MSSNERNKGYPSSLVSVLMCTYNNADYLDEAIESILNQSYQNIEFIIINDGSTDQTKDTILSYNSPKIRYFENEKNLGQVDSKNFGLSKAKGKYIAYMDGDDISEKERIAIQVEYLETHPEIGFCSTGVTFIGQRKGSLLTAETDESIRLDGLFSTPMAHATFLFRREILVKYNINYVHGFLATEDYWFMLLLLDKAKAYSIQQPLYRYRWHGKNISVKKSDLQFRNFKKISRTAFKQILKIDFSKENHHLVYSIFRGKITITEVKKVHPILMKALKSSDSDLVQAFKKIYAKNVIRVYYEKAVGLLSGYK